MENRHEVVVAKVVAFVFVREDIADDLGTEFGTPTELFAHVDQLQKGQRLLFDKGFARWPEVGVEYRTKLVRLVDGSVAYDIGVGAGTVVGELRYGFLCTKCHKMTWWEKDYSHASQILCSDCSEAQHHIIPDDREYFDNEY